MGQRIYLEGAKTLVMELECEGSHGLFEKPKAAYRGEDYILMRQTATADGWRRSGNAWRCPGCKAPACADEQIAE